jgi:endonuclease YncB( thermonuclease family)
VQGPANNDYRCGERAASALTDIVGERSIYCRWADRDRDGLVLGTCTTDGTNIGLTLVEQGWAVANRDCECEAYRNAAAKAEATKLGLWAGGFEMPWDWQRAQ